MQVVLNQLFHALLDVHRPIRQGVYVSSPRVFFYVASYTFAFRVGVHCLLNQTVTQRILVL